MEMVNWKWLIQLALLGSSGLEQYAIVLVRVSVGNILRHLSGPVKLFVAGGTETCLRHAGKGQSPVSPPDGLFRVRASEVHLRIPGGCGISLNSCLLCFNDRYDCRHPDQCAFHFA